MHSLLHYLRTSAGATGGMSDCNLVAVQAALMPRVCVLQGRLSPPNPHDPVPLFSTRPGADGRQVQSSSLPCPLLITCPRAWLYK